MMFSIIMPVAFFFLFTSTVGSDTKVGGVDWSSYYLMSMTCYGIIGASFTTFSNRLSRERSQGWIRLLRITPLPSWAYVVSKLVAQGIINLFIVVMMFVIGGFGKQISLPVVGLDRERTVDLDWRVIIHGTWNTCRHNEKSGCRKVLSTVIYMGLSVVGGLWFPIDGMSSTMQTISKFTPTYRLGQGAWNIIGGGSVDWSGVGILAAYVVVFMIISSYILKKQEAV